ncbi:hypothetical protein U1Q18_021663 [Sarracenia purpurea var. burkii]
MDLTALFLELAATTIFLVTKPFSLVTLSCIFGVRSFCIVIHTWLELLRAAIIFHAIILWKLMIWTFALISLPVRVLTALQRERLVEGRTSPWEKQLKDRHRPERVPPICSYCYQKEVQRVDNFEDLDADKRYKYLNRNQNRRKLHSSKAAVGRKQEKPHALANEKRNKMLIFNFTARAAMKKWIELENLAWNRKELQDRLQMAIKECRMMEAMLEEVEDEHDEAIVKIEILESEFRIDLLRQWKLQVIPKLKEVNPSNP